MTERTQRIVSTSDLVAFVLRCGKCQAPFELDPKSRDHRDSFGIQHGDRHVPPEKACPFCDEPFDRVSRVAFYAFCDFLYYAGLAKLPPEFRLADPGPSSAQPPAKQAN